VNVLLLTHIRNAFQIHRVDRIITQRRKGDTEPKRELIETLVGLEGAPWAEWAGLDDTAVPHRLTPGDIGRLLSPFRIKSKTIWPTPRKPGDKSDSGYFASQFERVWAFCPETDTPPQERKINHLHKFQAATPPATLRATTQLPREELHRDFLAAWAETIEAETIDRKSALCGHP
jgi:hypothetical protein